MAKKNSSSKVKQTPFYAGWIADTTSPSTSTEAFDVYQTKNLDYRGKEETYFYDERLIEFEENEWYSFLIEYLVGELFGDFDFAGEGAEDVRNYFEKTDPKAFDEVLKLGLNVVREGTGAFKKFFVKEGKGGRTLQQIRAINGRLIRLKWSESISDIIEPEDTGSTASEVSSNYKYLHFTLSSDKKYQRTFKVWEIKTEEELIDDEIALCRIRRDPRSPYGIGFGRSCLHILKALKMVNRDILAGIKGNLASLKVVHADFSGLDTPALKLAAAKEMAVFYEKLASATNGVVVVDKEHEGPFYMGTEGSSGESRLIQIMTHIEPILSPLLMNHLMSIGIIEQSGANKSIISRQEIRANEQKKRYQRAVARFFETQIFPEITDKKCRMIYRQYLDPEIWLSLFEKNIISREKILEEFSIIDIGKTFAADLTPVVAPVGKPSGSGDGPDFKTDSNDDSSDLRGREEE